MHGDAAFAGQGICAETLNMAGVAGFTVGGSVHIIVNNLIGFTTMPRDTGSSRFSSDLAKRLPIPIFHVNAEDPDAVVRVGRMAIEYRDAFGTPVVVDMIGYRRHGHSEVDDPTITQPLRYRKIEAHPPMWRIYSEQIGVDPEPVVAARARGVGRRAEEAKEIEKNSRRCASCRATGAHSAAGATTRRLKWTPGSTLATLAAIGEASRRAIPSGFHIHPKVKKLLEQRLEMAQGKRAIDFGMAEALAFGSLLKQRRAGAVFRAGQPARNVQSAARGADRYRERRRVRPARAHGAGEAWFEIYNSPLSEASVLGFEYGFSRDFPEALVLWEAQFGDFANGAQIIIDQFISASEDKWNLLSGVVMLAAARLRRAGAGTFERAHRAISAAGGARQYSDLPAFDGRAVFSSAAAAGAARWRKAAGRFHAEEHAAESGGVFAARGFGGGAIPERDSGSRATGRPSACCCAPGKSGTN